MFPYIVATLGALVLVAVVVHEIRSWRKPGHAISQNAPMGDGGVNDARLTNRTNIHNDTGFGGTTGGL